MDLYWAIEQLLSYGLIPWIAFISIAAGAAYTGRWWVIISGQVVVAILVDYLDIVYQSQHAAEMDADGIFAMGMLGRMLLINTVLLPLSAVVLLAAIQRRKRISSPQIGSGETTWPPAPKA